MGREGELGRGADGRQEFAEGRGGHGPPPFRGEDIDARRHLLALQPAKGADLGASKEMHAGPAVLPAGDVVAAVGQIEHVPPKRAELACPEPVAVGQEDHGRVAVGVARTDALPRGDHQAIDLLGGEVLAGAPLGIGKAPRRDFPIFSG